MNTSAKNPDSCCHWRQVFASLFITFFSLGVGAAPPPVNSVISNQAVASYVDGTGTPRTVNSNLVQSTVAQVGAFALTGTHTKVGALGATVYMQHSLVNHGNGPDTFTVKVAENAAPGLFSQIAVYHDANGTGLPSDAVPLCTSTGPQSCHGQGLERTLAGGGAEFRFLVAYTVPAHGRLSSIQSASARVTAEPSQKTSSFYATYAPASYEQVDTVNFTTGAAFTVLNTIEAPVQTLPQGAWPAAVSSAKASPTGCSTQWSSTLLSANALCTYTVLTLAYTNSGALGGDLTLRETLPPGLSYVRGSAVWSGMAGLALAEDALARPQGSGATKIHYAYAPSTATLNATVLNVGPNVSGTISFVVLVNNLARPGTSTTTSVATYFSSSCNVLSNGVNATNCGGLDPSTSPTPPVATNGIPLHVLPTYGVVAAGIASTQPDGSRYPPMSGDNLVERARVTAGGVVQFTNVITNTGNATDTFDVLVNQTNGGTGFPEGTRFQVLRADGLTPLTDTNLDGEPDTGPLAPGASVEITVQIQLPFLAKIGTGPMSVLLTASSIGNGGVPDPLASDSVWNRVNSVIGSVVDLTGTAAGNTSIRGTPDLMLADDCRGGYNCDVGQGPSAAPTVTRVVHPGIGTVFNLFLRNNDTMEQSYALIADLPTGWQVKFVVGENARCDEPAMAQPVLVGVGAQLALGACVTPTSGATLGLSAFRLTARSVAPSTNGNVVSDSLTYAANVIPAAVRALTLSPPSATGVASIGGFVVQSIALTNSGNQNCVEGNQSGLDVSAVLNSSAWRAGWRTSLYYDKNSDGALDANDVLLTPVAPTGSGNLSDQAVQTVGVISPLVPGGVIKLLLKTHASANATAQSEAVVTVEVLDRSNAACEVPMARYTYTAQNENIRVVKTQVLDASCSGAAALLANLSTDAVPVAPGQCLIYQVTLNNDGTAPLNDVSVSSGVPAFTSYTGAPGAQPGAQCEANRLSGTPVEFSTQSVDGAVRTASCGSAPNSLSPSGFVKLTYSVKVDQ